MLLVQSIGDVSNHSDLLPLFKPMLKARKLTQVRALRVRYPSENISEILMEQDEVNARKVDGVVKMTTILGHSIDVDIKTSYAFGEIGEMAPSFMYTSQKARSNLLVIPLGSVRNIKMLQAEYLELVQKTYSLLNGQSLMLHIEGESDQRIQFHTDYDRRILVPFTGETSQRVLLLLAALMSERAQIEVTVMCPNVSSLAEPFEEEILRIIEQLRLDEVITKNKSKTFQKVRERTLRSLENLMNGIDDDSKERSGDDVVAGSCFKILKSSAAPEDLNDLVVQEAKHGAYDMAMIGTKDLECETNPFGTMGQALLDCVDLSLCILHTTPPLHIAS